MPIYEYICSDCGCRFELLRCHADADLQTPCPECSGSSRRGISAFACGRGAGSESGPSRPTSRCGSCSGRSCANCR